MFPSACPRRYPRVINCRWTTRRTSVSLSIAVAAPAGADVANFARRTCACESVAVCVIAYAIAGVAASRTVGTQCMAPAAPYSAPPKAAIAENRHAPFSGAQLRPRWRYSIGTFRRRRELVTALSIQPSGDTNIMVSTEMTTANVRGSRAPHGFAIEKFAKLLAVTTKPATAGNAATRAQAAREFGGEILSSTWRNAPPIDSAASFVMKPSAARVTACSGFARACLSSFASART